MENELVLLNGSKQEIDTIQRAVEDMMARAWADNTRRAYRSDWEHFVTWCAGYGAASGPPAAAATVAAYLTHMSTHGSKLSTIRRWLAAISFAHRAVRQESPARDMRVKAVVRGITNTLGSAPARKKGLMVDDLRLMLGKLPANLRGVRDKAILLIGFTSACRRSELVALNREDVEETAEGLLIHIGKSKTDQAGKGRDIGIRRGKAQLTCPVRAMADWLRESGIESGPLWRPIDRAMRPKAERLQPRAIARIVQGACESIGLNPRQFGAHSLRRGLVTAAFRAMEPLDAIMQQTGHRRVDTVMGYVQREAAMKKSPTGNLGL